MKLGQVVSIQIAARAGAPLTAVERVRAVAGMGLEGDRYYARQGTYSYPLRGHAKKHDGSRELTLIETEALEALKRDYGLELSPLESRRNIATRGVPLNHLVGQKFKIGGAVMRGIRLCEPCGHLEALAGKPVKAGLVHRGGLRAQILQGGQIRVDDPIETVEA
jgi:MOSC domain-containing protein YiiM